MTRIHMAASVGFHIVFSVIGMAMPFLMAIADRRWRVTGGPVYLTLTRAWSNGVSIFFAIGAVSGTALSFALGHFLQGWEAKDVKDAWTTC